MTEGGAAAIERVRDLMDEMRTEPSGSRAVRLYRPSPTVALSRRESLLPGFRNAEAAARDAGFEPVIRLTGGRAVAYDESCMVLDVVTRETDPIDNAAYFAATSQQLVMALRSLGVDARIGEVAGEYCPGEYSVNARGAVKMMGTSQRVSRGVRLLSAMLPIGEAEACRAVLVEVNSELGLDWDPSTFGTLAAEVGHLGFDVVRDAFVQNLQ